MFGLDRLLLDRAGAVLPGGFAPLKDFARSAMSGIRAREDAAGAQHLARSASAALPSVFRQRRFMYIPPPVVRPEFLAPSSPEKLRKLNVQKTYHLRPQNIGDRLAYVSVRALRVLADVFFYKRYVHRAIVLETVAAIPGMVGGFVRHMRSLRTMTEDGSAIRSLMAEAENERIHLMTWMEVSKPWWCEKAMVLLLQGFFFNGYLALYLLFPRVAHRFVGYLEEQAIISYTEMISDIKSGKIPNVEAPEIAKKYWNLAEGSRLLEVARAVRADEAAHRDANHAFADEMMGKKRQKEGQI